MKSLFAYFTYCLLIYAPVSHATLQIYRPFNRMQTNQGLSGPAVGYGACGNGAGSQWIRASPPSKWLSEYGTDYLLVFPGMKLTLVYDTPVSGTYIHQLQYCSPPADFSGSEQIDESCFQPMERSPEEDQTPYIEEYPTIDYFLEPSCTSKYAMSEPEYRTSWIVPKTIQTQWPVIFRWVVQLSYNSCVHPAVCPPNIPDAIKNWIYKDPETGMECPIAIGNTPAGNDNCPLDDGCKTNKSQSKLCIDAYAINITANGNHPSEGGSGPVAEPREYKLSAEPHGSEAAVPVTPPASITSRPTVPVVNQFLSTGRISTNVTRMLQDEAPGTYNRELVSKVGALVVTAAISSAPHAVNFENLRRYMALTYLPQGEDYAYLAKEAYWLLHMLNGDFCDLSADTKVRACRRWCVSAVEDSGSTLNEIVKYCAAAGVSSAVDCIVLYARGITCLD